tara:strand:+ start:1825 stop:2559 length:735 start_codon:yes stop_codon:yes gene_type:complete
MAEAQTKEEEIIERVSSPDAFAQEIESHVDAVILLQMKGELPDEYSDDRHSLKVSGMVREFSRQYGCLGNTDFIQTRCAKTVSGQSLRKAPKFKDLVKADIRETLGDQGYIEEQEGWYVPETYPIHAITTILNEVVEPHLTRQGEGFREEFGYLRRAGWSAESKGEHDEFTDWHLLGESAPDFRSTSQLDLTYRKKDASFPRASESNLFRKGFLVSGTHTGQDFLPALEAYKTVLEEFCRERKR